MNYQLFSEDHEIFRRTVRKFVENEITPYGDEWEEKEEIPRELFKKMGELGFLGIQYPEKYGGSALDFIYVVVFVEELARSGVGGVRSSVGVHSLMATPPLDILGTEEQKQKYLIPAIKGEMIGALGISEPNAGSDVAGIQTFAVKDGDDYVINGSKIFITNGSFADFVTLAAKTSREKGHKGISLFILDTKTPGFSVGRKLKKMGLHCSGTAELVIEDVRLPKNCLLGEEGRGFYGIMKNFEEERLVAAISNVSAAQFNFELALQYAKERVAFGKPIGKYQVISHKLVDMATEIEATRQLVYYACAKFTQGIPAQKEIAMAKYLSAEMGNRVVYSATQIFGGYGYMKEYPIERSYRDARVATIAGGTTEIMKEIVVKQLGL